MASIDRSDDEIDEGMEIDEGAEGMIHCCLIYATLITPGDIVKFHRLNSVSALCI